MSQYFQVGELVLWNPSHTVAQLFARMTEAMVPVAGCPSGVGPDIGRDEYEVDPDIFAAFVDALTMRYLSTNHPILTAMLEGYLPAALVMVRRSGRDLPALERQIARGSRDVSLNRDVFDPDGDRQRLLNLAERHARDAQLNRRHRRAALLTRESTNLATITAPGRATSESCHALGDPSQPSNGC
ncbi:DUF6086 family protein [Micromonospora sp. 15K316]|uniref:DUF6086 family protein n=1 Tax=Micromonospora sp. 15K316 TaxID=2530376 RepID=UPI001FB75B99|nr:DUF6086 family protein [Micromonospora sp. 15K316]